FPPSPSQASCALREFKLTTDPGYLKSVVGSTIDSPYKSSQDSAATHRGKVFMKGMLGLLAWTFCAMHPALSQQVAEKAAGPPRAEVLVLGVYHMANPGRDIFNTQAD